MHKVTERSLFAWKNTLLLTFIKNILNVLSNKQYESKKIKLLFIYVILQTIIHISNQENEALKTKLDTHSRWIYWALDSSWISQEQYWSISVFSPIYIFPFYNVSRDKLAVKNHLLLEKQMNVNSVISWNSETLLGFSLFVCTS